MEWTWSGPISGRPGDLSVAFEDVDVLVHLAACVVGDDDTRFASTVVGTERLLEAMSGSGIRRVVLASSFSVYDWNATHGTLNEASPLEANLYERDGYAVAKVWQERTVRAISEREGWDLRVLRPGLHLGSR